MATVTAKAVKLKDWQVAYLSSFIKRWDEVEVTGYPALILEYNEFLRDCKLPALSAEDLLTSAGWRAVA